MAFWKVFKVKSCSVALKATSKEEVLHEIVQTMIKGDALDSKLEKAAIAALIAREAQASTGVGMNVAIPHVQIAGLEQAVATVCVHPLGVEWSALDGEPVHILFTVLRPGAASASHDPEKHLEMMRWIARLGRTGDFRRFALQAKTKSELVDLLKEMANV
jgi:mannitol/fructose-specific phosphotransferase system IIA component (Ntr-type)